MDISHHNDMNGKLPDIPANVLAYIGDAVYSLMVRTYLAEKGIYKAGSLHKKTTQYVCAKAQASAAVKIMPLLSTDETEIYKRGRNINTAVPKSSSVEDYRAATGLEALFGYLYLSGNEKRLGELFMFIIENGKCKIEN